MTKLFSFREGSLYCHRSLDEHPQPEAFPIHAHETPEIYLFLSGRGEYLVEGSRYPLRPAVLQLPGPGRKCRKRISTGDVRVDRVYDT